MGKIAFRNRYPRSTGYVPQPGYRHVIGQCKKCLKMWTNVGIRFNDTTQEFVFDFDTRCEIIGEVVFDDKNEVVECKKCNGKVKFYQWTRQR